MVQANPRAPEVMFFQDELSSADMLRLYSAASVYVQPFRSEGFGLTILEALAMGLQVSKRASD